MAEKRMFAKSIVMSDAFLDMPAGSRALYLTLGMMADDDGFVNNVKSLMRVSSVTVDDLNVLIAKKFVIAFESGVVVIKHWKINNYVKSDRYAPTNYKKELAQLFIDNNRAYTLTEPEWNQSGTSLEPKWNQNGTKVEPQIRLDKIRKKENTKRKKIPDFLLNDDKTENNISQIREELFSENNK